MRSLSCINSLSVMMAPMPPLNRGVKDSTFPSNMGMGWQFYETTSEKSSVI